MSAHASLADAQILSTAADPLPNDLSVPGIFRCHGRRARACRKTRHPRPASRAFQPCRKTRPVGGGPLLNEQGASHLCPTYARCLRATPSAHPPHRLRAPWRWRQNRRYSHGNLSGMTHGKPLDVAVGFSRPANGGERRHAVRPPWRRRPGGAVAARIWRYRRYVDCARRDPGERPHRHRPRLARHGPVIASGWRLRKDHSGAGPRRNSGQAGRAGRCSYHARHRQHGRLRRLRRSIPRG